MKRYVLFLFLLLISLIGCSPRPRPHETLVPYMLVGREGLSKTGTSPALWLATTDFQNAGVLGRLDLKGGELKDLLPTGADVQIFPDGEKGLFLLTAMRNDSIHLLEGKGATVVAQRGLIPQVNPQGVARDLEGRIWLVSLDSNEVQVFSKDLKEEIETIDLSSSFKGDGDSWLELSSILFMAPNRMVVSASRIQRGWKWAPSSASGIAIIDTETFKVVSADLIDLSNPRHLYATGGESILVVGSGDLSQSLPLFGKWLNLSVVTLAASEKTTLPSRILDSALCADQKLAWIEWIPEEEKGCVRMGDQTLVCEQGDGGYAFNRLVCAGDILFVSYVKGGNAELWVILRDGTEIQRIPMKQPIQSLTLGP